MTHKVYSLMRSGVRGGIYMYIRTWKNWLMGTLTKCTLDWTEAGTGILSADGKRNLMTNNIVCVSSYYEWWSVY